MSRTIVLLTLAAGILLSVFPASADAQLQVEGKPRWGFDGFVRANKFNLLTVELFNNSDKPWQGDIRLQAQVGIGPADIPIVQPDLLIEPYGRRRLQFLVYISEMTDFTLRWGRRADEFLRIDEPVRSESPAVVQFVAGEAFRSGLKGIPTFDENDFPPSAAGLTGLGTVVLDHVPRWTETQSRAFRDWLHAGGTLHLYEETAGRFPEFSGLLTDLNRPGDGFPLGGGRVVRHSSTSAVATAPASPAQPVTARHHDWHTATSLFSVLKELTRPDHNWALIYLMAIAYLLLLFPGCWLLGRRRGDYRLTYGAILAIVFLFSVGFRTVGARGYGEQTSIHSAALVRPTADGRAIVTQWSNLFVTAGGTYEVSHPLEGNVYSSGQANEAVRGAALNRPYGKVLTDVPSFSSRSLVNTGVLSGFRWSQDAEPFGVEVVEMDASAGVLNKLSVKLNGIPRDQVFEVGAVHGRNYYQLTADSTGLFQLQHVAQNLDLVLNHDAWSTNVGVWNNQADDPQRLGELLNKLRPALIAWDLGLTGENQRLAFSLPPDQIRLYIFAQLPQGMFAKGISEQQSGRVVISVPLPIE